MEKELLRLLMIVQDEADFLLLEKLFSGTAEGVQLQWISQYQQGLEAALECDYDVILIDYYLEGSSGLQLIRQATEKGCAAPFILLTGQDDHALDYKAIAAEASDYLVKGEFDLSMLQRAIRYARGRKRAEEHIREQAALLDKATDAIGLYKPSGEVIYWNKSSERITGYSQEEALGTVIGDVLFEPDDPKVKDAQRTVNHVGEWVGELRPKTKDGRTIIVESRWTLVRNSAGQPKSILVMNTDVTERKKLESQFLRVQRMESIGRLISGIAHDLGNLLVPILLGVKVLQQRYMDDPKAQRTLQMIQQSGQRGADMVKQVLAFVRGVEGEHEAVCLSEIIEAIVGLARETVQDQIQLETAFQKNLWKVDGDATQLQQVFMNLWVNARDAMPGGGRHIIRVENIEVGINEARMNLDAYPGFFVKVSVIDSGEGIDSEVLDKVFEPFFTTKPIGKGTGLGLSTVYSIVKGHNGFVTISSEKRKGTCVQVYLPAVEDEERIVNGE